jgi:Zn-finger nucleic acid-binding protein
MERLDHAGVTVDRCSRCKGLWLDRGERESLLAAGVTDELDVGTDSLGRRWDAVQDVACPRCHTRCVRMTDAREPDVHFELCPSCGGSFFDAGELRRLEPRGFGARLRHFLGLT